MENSNDPPEPERPVRCSGCGAWNLSSERFCSCCGLPRTPALCTGCGHLIGHDQALYCPGCGLPLHLAAGEGKPGEDDQQPSTHNTTDRRRTMKKSIITPLALLLVGVALAGCNLDQLTGNDPEPIPLIRFLHFRYAEIPAGMSDATALQMMRSPVSSQLRATSIEHWFPTTDSITNPFSGEKFSVNRAIVTPAGSSNNGGTRLLGGQDAAVHPFQHDVPSSLLIDGLAVETAGETGSLGSFELRFNEDELIVGGDSRSNPMEFTLDSFNSQTTYATGKFLFIAHNLSDPSDTRRWAIFDGEYALQHGN